VWDAKEVLPYLRGRRDPYDSNSPHHRWKTTVSRSQLLNALSNEFGTRITGFVLGKRSEEGRLKTVTLLTPGGRMTVRANDFRLAITRRLPDADLKSTWFDASRRGDTYRFNGRGFGHGVGLSQWGIHEMSDRGKSYRDMLGFYYAGVEIRSADGDMLDVPDRPLATSPPPQERKDNREKEEESTRRIGW